jgi:BlaI family transcriptional regulator, penicillinase repressor
MAQPNKPGNGKSARTADAEHPPIAISEAESAVMQVLWRKNPLWADEIVLALSKERDWQEATIKTLLNRLLKKGALRAELEGRRYQYTPVLQRDHWLHAESTSMLNRLFGGRIAPLVAHFGDHRKLTATDIAELKKLVKALEKK